VDAHLSLLGLSDHAMQPGQGLLMLKDLALLRLRQQRVARQDVGLGARHDHVARLEPVLARSAPVHELVPPSPRHGQIRPGAGRGAAQVPAAHGMNGRA